MSTQSNLEMIFHTRMIESFSNANARMVRMVHSMCISIYIDCFLMPFRNKSISLVLPTFYVVPFIQHSLISHEISNIPPMQYTQKPNWLVEKALACDWICLGFDPRTTHFSLLFHPNSCCPASKGQTRICPPQFRVITEKLPH